MTMRYLFLCGLLILAGSLAAIKVNKLQPVLPSEKDATYYTDDGSAAVTLTRKEIATIQFIMSRFVGSSDNNPKYMQIVDEKLINILTGGCGSQCSSDAQLLRRVLKDFEGQNVEAVFSKLGLRREI